ncbi:MAG: transcriptional regulator [Treponema sp.]|nr:transcriptional regulator [Treponema sp.]
MNNSNNTEEHKGGISDELAFETIQELSKLMIKSGDEKFLCDFLVCLLSKPELKSIASRWLLVKDIDAGVTQREIAKKYAMSLCKITRGSKELNKPDSAFRKMLELLKNM